MKHSNSYCHLFFKAPVIENLYCDEISQQIAEGKIERIVVDKLARNTMIHVFDGECKRH